MPKGHESWEGLPFVSATHQSLTLGKDTWGWSYTDNPQAICGERRSPPPAPVMEGKAQSTEQRAELGGGTTHICLKDHQELPLS